MTPAPTAPPATCPIGWQPQALAPVFFGARSLGPPDGAPVPLRIFFPSLDGSAESAPLLGGCGRYPLVLFAHGHCQGDTDHYDRWFRIPAQLARAGYVVVVPHLAGNAGGESPSVSTHPDEATLDAVLSWARSGWEHAGVLLPPPATGVVGHSFGAMLDARFAVGRPVSRSSSRAATSAGSTRWAATRRARWPSTAPSSGSSRTPAARRPTPSTTRAPGSRGSQHGTGGWSRPVRRLPMVRLLLPVPRRRLTPTDPRSSGRPDPVTALVGDPVDGRASCWRHGVVLHRAAGTQPSRLTVLLGARSSPRGRAHRGSPVGHQNRGGSSRIPLIT